MMATLTSATMFAGIATVSATTFIIPDDAPDDVELPTVSPHGQMIDVRDEEVKSSRSQKNLEMGSDDVTFINRPLHGDTIVMYKVHNTGDVTITDTIDDGTWWRRGPGDWDLFIEKAHTEDLSVGHSYEDSYIYDFPSEWHWVCQETDCHELIVEQYERDNEVYRYFHFC